MFVSLICHCEKSMNLKLSITQSTRHSEPLGEESLLNLVRDLSLPLKMTKKFLCSACRRISCKPESLFRGRSLLRLALNGTVPNQIKKRGFRLWFVNSHACLEFLPRSQSFGKGTPFQKPQSVRYPA